MIYVAAFAADTQSIFHLALQRSYFTMSINLKYRIICKNNIVFISFETANLFLSEGRSIKNIW